MGTDGDDDPKPKPPMPNIPWNHLDDSVITLTRSVAETRQPPPVITAGRAPAAPCHRPGRLPAALRQKCLDTLDP